MVDWTDDELIEDAEQGMFEHFRLNVDAGQEPIRIDKFMSSHLEDTSRHRIQCAIKLGYVKVGEKTAKANLLVRPGDIIRFVMPYRRRGVDIVPQDIPLDIVYEDDDVLVVNKPAGMVVHPGHGHFDGTLVNALLYHFSSNCRQSTPPPTASQSSAPPIEGDGPLPLSRGWRRSCGGVSAGSDAPPMETDPEKAGILVHRIDKDTSGLLLVAKNDEAQLKLAKQFFNHTTERRYQAIVWGDIKENEGTIDKNITRDPGDRIRFKVTDNPDEGKHAVTHYHVLERFGFVTLVECQLETGRTHQIRVHMASIGHPLFNDERYGGAEIRKGTIYSKYRQFIKNCFEICPRQALHAKTLGFEHPVTRKWLQFDSVVPADMTALLDKWRKYAGNMPEEEEEQ
ncbi:MAG: RluA family pseudouridine synthase [Bacteroidales bacterium]|nr:RluA family pseudouridine synthase [Bacteroidales bacterium]